MGPDKNINRQVIHIQIGQGQKNNNIENPNMFPSAVKQTLITISQAEQKLETYRQLLNQQIQFNIKDLYILISGSSAQVTAYHLHVFMSERPGEGEGDGEGAVELRLVQSVIKCYNCASSMNLSFIQFAMLFLSRQNRLLAKLTIERNSLGQIPAYLLSYTKKILHIETNLHRTLLQFRKAYSSAAEQWIRENSHTNEQTGEEEFDEKAIDKICSEVEIDQEEVKRYLRVGEKQGIKANKMGAIFTLRNCGKISEFFRKAGKTQGGFRTELTDPFIRPEFHDCLQRPKILENFSHREIKSIEKHLERLNSRSKTQLTQKITHYRSFIQKQLVLACEAMSSIIELQNEIEQQRIQLCLCTDFYPVLFYDSFNKDRQMLLIPSSLQSYLERLGMKIELNSLYLVFKRYSTRPDGKLNFNQFCAIFDAYNSEYSQIERNREVKKLEDIDIETIKHFLKLIRVLVRNEVKIQKIKSKLQTQVDLREIFTVFDEDEDGFISMLDFRVVWKKYLLMDLREDKVGLLWHRMRMPKSSSTMIKYERFIAQMMPRSSWVDKPKSSTVTGKVKLRSAK